MAVAKGVVKLKLYQVRIKYTVNLSMRTYFNWCVTLFEWGLKSNRFRNRLHLSLPICWLMWREMRVYYQCNDDKEIIIMLVLRNRLKIIIEMWQEHFMRYFWIWTDCLIVFILTNQNISGWMKCSWVESTRLILTNAYYCILKTNYYRKWSSKQKLFLYYCRNKTQGVSLTDDLMLHPILNFHTPKQQHPHNPDKKRQAEINSSL